MSRPNPLGRAALVVAILAAVVTAVSTPVTLILQVNGGMAYAPIVFGDAAVVGIIAAVALGLGIAAARRPLSNVGAGAAIGIGALLLLGQVVGVVAVLVALVA